MKFRILLGAALLLGGVDWAYAQTMCRLYSNPQYKRMGGVVLIGTLPCSLCPAKAAEVGSGARCDPIPDPPPPPREPTFGDLKDEAIKIIESAHESQSPTESLEGKIKRGLEIIDGASGPQSTGSDFETQKTKAMETLGGVLIPKGFTGKRLYYMFAKSWINGPAIAEPSWAARKIKMDANVEPKQAIAGTAFDYKIYQSFGAETEFVDGKIVNALFVRGSKQQLTNTTFGLRGEVHVTRDDVTVSSDKTSVVFERRIEGNPHMLIKAADLAAAEAVARSWGLVGLYLPATNIKIYSVLRLTVTADGATPHGEGSSFPTHYFWIREKQSDRRFRVQRQVQPSQYFR